MARLRLLWAYFGNLLRALTRKLPLRPSWTVRYEALVRTMQAAFVHAQGLDARGRREYFDSIAMRSRVKRKVAMTNVITGGIPATWVVPKGVTGPARPLIVFFHGGGYQFGSIEGYADLLARLAVSAKTRVLAVDYRLAPESPYPAALDDAIAVLQWLRENGHKDVVLAGDSAGGNLAIATMLRLRELNEPLPLRAATICPWVDMASVGVVENYAFDVIPRGAPEEWARAFLKKTDYSAPLVSPLKADLHGLPPMLIQVGGAEIAHADVLAFAKKASQAGVDVTLSDYADMTHVWHLFAPMGVPEAQKAIDELGAFLGQPLPPRPPPTMPPTAP